MLFRFYLGILLCATGSFALYDSSSDVVELNPSNFDRLVTNSDDVWIVEFFAPWCGHCKNLVPEYNKAAKALKGIVKVGGVDADAHKSLGQQFGVSGFPTIKIFKGSKHTPYQGARNAEGFVDAAIKATKDKAYERLGKKPSSSDKLRKLKRVYGHHIPWKKVMRTKKLESVTKGQVAHPRVVTTVYGKGKLRLLQAHLFRRMADPETPKIIKAKRISKPMRRRRFLI